MPFKPDPEPIIASNIVLDDDQAEAFQEFLRAIDGETHGNRSFTRRWLKIMAATGDERDDGDDRDNRHKGKRSR